WFAVRAANSVCSLSPFLQPNSGLPEFGIFSGRSRMYPTSAERVGVRGPHLLGARKLPLTRLAASGERWSSWRLRSLSTAPLARLNEFARLARPQFFAATTSFTAPTQPVWVRSNTMPSGSLYLAS